MKYPLAASSPTGPSSSSRAAHSLQDLSNSSNHCSNVRSDTRCTLTEFVSQLTALTTAKIKVSVIRSQRLIPSTFPLRVVYHFPGHAIRAGFSFHARPKALGLIVTDSE